MLDGKVKRVRASIALAPYSEYPYKGTKADLERLRQKFHEKITSVLVSVNRENAVAGTQTLGEFIERSYFPRLDWRLSVPAGNELHIEPFTMKGYKDIWIADVQHKPIEKIRVRDFTTRDGQRFLESLPQHLSHQTHLRIKNFVRGVFTWAIADDAFVGANPMEETKAGGQTKKEDALKGLTEKERLRKNKIQASDEHAYTLEEVAEMLDKLPEPARTVCAVAAFTGLARSELRGLK
jgi:integrase